MKPIEAILKPDERSTMLSYSKINPDGSKGEWNRFDLEYYYINAKECSLPEEAPEDIRELWETAQHLLVYAYFEYPFIVAADLHCTMVVEAALRKECASLIAEYNRRRAEGGKKPRDPNFSGVLDFFKEKTLEVLTPEEAQFLYERLDAMRNLRNSFAHAQKQSLYPTTMSLLRRTSEWLGAYYRGELKQFVQKWMKYSEDRNKETLELLERDKRESAI